MQAQRERARSARKANQRVAVPDLRDRVDVTKLRQDESAVEAKVVCIWKDGVLVDELQSTDKVAVDISYRKHHYRLGLISCLDIDLVVKIRIVIRIVRDEGFL